MSSSHLVTRCFPRCIRRPRRCLLLPLLLLQLLLLLGLVARGQAGTIVSLGTVSQFSGVDDPALDLTGQFAYAINFSADDPVRTVQGLAFRPDTQPVAGAVLMGPQNVAGWQGKPEYGVSADANALEEIMHDIRWANAGGGEKLQARLAVEPGIPYKIQLLISGNHSESRRWDIRFNGQNAVDELTSLGVSPGESFAANRSTLWSHEFVPTASPVVVEMGDFFGGNDGGDRNPIWQALTLERVYIPPTPDDITLSSTHFFPAQREYIANVVVADGKFKAVHETVLVDGAGSEDNDKFVLSGGRLRPGAIDFSGQPVGTTYNVRLRATDVADAARFLEKSFTLQLAEPHAPSAVVSTASSLSSGLIPGQLAGSLSAMDVDDFDRPVFELVAGDGDAQNQWFRIDGNEIRLISALPAGLFDARLRVRVTDLAGLSHETMLVWPVIEPRVRLHEVLVVSTDASRPLDQSGQPSDWIELYNELAQPVNLDGWHLSDDVEVPDKWTFPAVAIPPNGYLLVFASGTGLVPASGPLHTTFRLSQGGERLVLSRPDGVVLSDWKLPEMYPNVTYGMPPSSEEPAFLRSPTPGAANALAARAGRNEVSFSEPHGFKNAVFSLTLTATVPGSVIRFTLDGKVPTAASPVYQSPVTISPVAGTVKSGTRIVRALAFHPEAAYAPVATQTYVFVNGVAGPKIDGVIGQSNFFNSIRNHATYGPLLDEAFLSLPAVSLTINGSDGLPFSETPSSIELFDPLGGEPGFTIPAGIIRSGTTSLGFDKGSMSARFRGEYGATHLNYPVYGRHPYDAQGAATEFKELRLRSCSHDTHSWQGTAENPPVPYGSPAITRSGDAQLIRNIWIEDMQLRMGQPGKHGRMVNMFVNGNYYGIYHIQEHADEDYMGSYYPGGSDDYHFTGGATTGSTHDTESWSQVWAQLKSSLGNYAEAQRWVDVTNLADYMILSFYAGNDWDWTTQHNWGAAGPRLPDRGGWKFFQQDQDISLQAINADSTDQGVPDNIFPELMRHADFRVLFRDRIYKHLFHDGVLTPGPAAAGYELRAQEINSAMVAETVRWQPGSSVGPLPWDRDGEWTVERNYLMNTYFPRRATVQVGQFRSRGWYPVDAPEMSQRGGAVVAGTEVFLTAPAGAMVYYTLNGSDPRLPGGAVHPAARPYRSSVTRRTLVAAHDDQAGAGAVWKFLAAAADPGPSWKSADYDDSGWAQGAVESGYGDGDEVTNVGFVDVDPATAGIQRNLTTYFRHEFTVDSASSISGLTIRLKRDDGAVVYLNGREVFRSAMPVAEVGFSTPGNGGVGVEDDGNAWFVQSLAASEYDLRNGRNVIAVEVHNAAASSSDISFDLELAATIPATPEPVLVTSATTLKTRALVGAEWSAVNEAFFFLAGTEPASTSNVAISEIQYHPAGSETGAEFLELANTASYAVRLSGVTLSGAVDFTFPEDMVLLPGEMAVVVKDRAIFAARYQSSQSPWFRAGLRVAGEWSGSLANEGESIRVTAADQSPILAVTWSDAGAWPGRADGRGSSLELVSLTGLPVTQPEKDAFLADPGHWRPSSEFHGSPGALGNGPDRRMIINEVLPASLAPAVDFIELLNISEVRQQIGGWFLSDTSDDYRKFRIPDGTTVEPGALLAIDESHFNNPENPGCVVPFALSSSGDDVFLIAADAAGNFLRFADRVEFGAVAGGVSWGRSPDGVGPMEWLRSPTVGLANAAVLAGYPDWVATSFPAASAAAVTGPALDPDGDGLTNWAEFAFVTQPLVADASTVQVVPGPADAVTFTYRIRADASAVAAVVTVSNDLVSWSPAGPSLTLLNQSAPHADGSIVVTASLPVTNDWRFLRVEGHAVP